jgi:hypothetical protein
MNRNFGAAYLFKQLQSVGRVSFRRCSNCDKQSVLFSKISVGKFGAEHEVGFIAESIKEAYIREFGQDAFNIAQFQNRYKHGDEDEKTFIDYLFNHHSHLFLSPCRMFCCLSMENEKVLGDRFGKIANDIIGVKKTLCGKPRKCDEIILDRISTHIFEVNCDGVHVEKQILRDLRANSFDVQIITRQPEYMKEYQMIFIRNPNNAEKYDLLASNILHDTYLDRNVLFDCVITLGKRYHRFVSSRNTSLFSSCFQRMLVLSNASLCEWIVENIGITVRWLQVRNSRNQLHYRLDVDEDWQFVSNDRISTRKEACKRVVRHAAFVVISRLAEKIRFSTEY